MVRQPFDESEWEDLLGPSDAFEPQNRANPSVYAIQNHLALEVMAHLTGAAVPILFQGGTALHAKLGDRKRFSIDLDLKTTNSSAVHVQLREFAARFGRSQVVLEEPPDDLRVEGVRHTLVFNRTRDEVTPAPLRILVDVVETEQIDHETETLTVRADGFDWGVEALTPTFEGFAAQKFATIGPETIGKRVGRNATCARGNQGVCKQIYDLSQLLRRDLDGNRILSAYRREVSEGNRLRHSAFNTDQVLRDAGVLLRALKDPRPEGTDNLYAYGLWSGYEDSWRYIRGRPEWTEARYRICGGVLHRVAQEMLSGRLRWGLVSQPVVADRVPEPIATRLNSALESGDSWVASDGFAGDLRIAWAWSPEEFW